MTHSRYPGDHERVGARHRTALEKMRSSPQQEPAAQRPPGAAPTSSIGASDFAHSLLERAEQIQRALHVSPLVPLQMSGIKLCAKLEYCSLAGSLKDRPALWILRSAIARGEVDQDTTIIESSSGNFAIAIATYCRLLGLRFTAVIDPNISKLNESILRSICESVVMVDQQDDTGGFLKTRLATVRDLRARSQRTFWPNQYGNIDGMLGHYYITGGEICDTLPNLDYVFIGVSSGGTVAGVSRRVKEHFPRAKVVAVDVEGSVIFGGPPKKRHIPGIGASVVPDLLREANIDEVIVVPEIDTVAGCRELLVQHHLFVGGSSGSVYWAIKQFFGEPRSGPAEPTVLFLCADRGTAYIDTIYNDAWYSNLMRAR